MMTIGGSMGAVAVDTPCRKCQYNLRGMSFGGRCPECGTLVGLSVRGDLIRYSDPNWIDRLRWGVTCVLWTLIVIIVGVSLRLFELRWGGTPRLPSVFVGLAADGLYLTGGWLLTTPDPGGVGENRYGTSRKVVRMALLFGLLRNLIAATVQIFTPSPNVGLCLAIVSSVASAFVVIGTFATLNYLRKLATRVPDDVLSSRARRIMYGLGIPFGVLVFGGIAAVFVAFTGLGPGPSVGGLLIPVGCGAALCSICVLVYGINYLFVLGAFARTFKAQAALARREWSVRPSPNGSPPGVLLAPPGPSP